MAGALLVPILGNVSCLSHGKGWTKWVSYRRTPASRPDQQLPKARLLAADLPSVSKIVVLGPATVRREVADALGTDHREIGWVLSCPAVEEHVAATRIPIDVLVLSPGVEEVDAFPMAERLTMASPGTAIVMLRDASSSSDGLGGAHLWDVVDTAGAPGALRRAVEKAGWLGRASSQVLADVRSQGGAGPIAGRIRPSAVG